jgi:hypothetical protein
MYPSGKYNFDHGHLITEEKMKIKIMLLLMLALILRDPREQIATEVSLPIKEK